LFFLIFLSFFFFQAEDGIRDRTVTGVQTCALPISLLLQFVLAALRLRQAAGAQHLGEQSLGRLGQRTLLNDTDGVLDRILDAPRSEERRVGKECRSRW